MLSRWTLLVFVIVIALLDIRFLGVAASTSIEARNAIVEAQAQADRAYGVIVDAERAGANVTGLVEEFNRGWVLLEAARMRLSLNDANDAYWKASNSSSIFLNVAQEAETARSNAVMDASQRILSTILGSIVTVVALTFGSYFLSRTLRRRGYEAVLRRRPEVVERALNRNIT